MAVSFNEAGDEVVRVPMQEPTYLRQAFDEKYQTYRTNIT